MAGSLTLETADEADLDYIEQLLRRNELPTADVRSKQGCFYVAVREDVRVGTGGLEVSGVDGLLRSVVVEASARGDGVGTAICDALEARARRAGVETLYLLTTTAAGFFADRGYERIERRAAPDAITATNQFADLCPSSATCMRTSL